MDDKFTKLIDNGFDFLEKAISQFKKEPKYSVINFCVATELFLKARLMNEHWSLIVAGNPDLTAFKNGNFKSINFKDLIPKIEAVTGERIDMEIKKCFEGLADHRNKMIHFFHDGHSGNSSNRVLEKIAIEQSSGWHYLRELLEKWREIFDPYEERIYLINSKMKKHEVYISTVYDKILPEIKLALDKGSIFIKCRVCRKKSSEVEKLSDYLYKCQCKVCHYSEEFLQIPCNHDGCDGIIKIDGYSSGQTHYICPECDNEISYQDLSDLIDSEPSSHDDYVGYVSLNCAECDIPGEVIKHGAYYICLNCLQVDEDIAVCEWCNEGQIGGGSLEYSNLSGCGFCEGAAGSHRDD